MQFDAQYYPYPSRRNLVYAKRGMVASSHPLATQAGLHILRQGGNAVDAALAVAAALTVVDPANNGPGGDCFAIVQMGGKLYGLNSSGYAPAAMDADGLRARGESIPLRGWSSVTVPGAPAGWNALCERFGTLPLTELFAPAVELAQGYALSPDNAPILNAFTREFANSAYAEVRCWAQGFNPDGKTFHPGQLYALPELGNTLARLAQSRGRDLYEGDLAEQIDKHARKTGGALRGEDLAAYQPRWVEPLHIPYHGYEVWELPPNGQGMTALLALRILDGLPLDGGRDSVQALHQQMEAVKLAFADALNYVADPAYLPVPPETLLSEEYAAGRRALLGQEAQVYAPGAPLKGDTVYFCTADGQGNSVSMIQSLYQGFGSGVLIPGTGLCLQDRGACFSLKPGHPNEAAPRKYPYHTIIPGYLTAQGKPVGPFGIMGGYMQPQAHVQVLMNLIDFGLNPQAALDAPRFCWTQGLDLDMEPGYNPAVVEALRRLGHRITVRPGGQYGRGQIIFHTPDGTLVGATEPRADGSVIGF